MKCANQSCDRTFNRDQQQQRKLYCSAECQRTARNASGHRSLNDVTVPMSAWHQIVERAEVEMMTPQEWLGFALTDSVYF